MSLVDPFATLIGNDAIKEILTRMAKRRQVPHALLFAGPDGIGKSLFATAFAQLLLKNTGTSGTHPDLRIYRPEGKIGMHAIENLREFSTDVYMPPYQAERKVFIMHDAHRMLTYSANALLKTLEEPASHSLIILLSSEPHALLPTILSRCQLIRFQPIPEEQLSQWIRQTWGKDETEARLLARLSRGSLSQTKRLIEKGPDAGCAQLLSILAQGKMTSYTHLMETAKALAERIEASKQQCEESTRESLLKGYPTDLTAAQQQALDKEIEGMGTMHQHQEAHAAFDTLLSWYRDLHLLAVGGDPAYLLHSDCRDQMEQALQRGETLPLEKVQASLADARLAVERSTPLVNCFETLFLQLELL